MLGADVGVAEGNGGANGVLEHLSGARSSAPGRGDRRVLLVAAWRVTPSDSLISAHV